MSKLMKLNYTKKVASRKNSRQWSWMGCGWNMSSNEESFCCNSFLADNMPIRPTWYDILTGGRTAYHFVINLGYTLETVTHFQEFVNPCKQHWELLALSKDTSTVHVHHRGTCNHLISRICGGKSMERQPRKPFENASKHIAELTTIWSWNIRS